MCCTLTVTSSTPAAVALAASDCWAEACSTLMALSASWPALRAHGQALLAHVDEHLAQAIDKAVEGVGGVADFIAVAYIDAYGQVALAAGQLLHGVGQGIQRTGQRTYYGSQYQEDDDQGHHADDDGHIALAGRRLGNGRGGDGNACRPELASFTHLDRVEEVGEAAVFVDKAFALFHLFDMAAQHVFLG